MKIAILHYHLDTGGVTQVIRQQAAVLKALDHDVILLTGKLPPSPMDVPVEKIHGLGYDRADREPVPADNVVSQIMGALNRRWSHSPDILHVHNPLLAKNRRLIDILNKLQNNGVRLLCQVHDFAEDGRPNMFFHDPYPCDCHYAVVNLRDYHILKAAGLAPQGLHYLPNPVSPWPRHDGHETAAQKSVLYPVRAIRRKNIAEAILIHFCRHPDLQLRITLPPSSPPDRPAYDLWRRLVDRRGLNVLFEAGLKFDFNLLTAQCQYVLTTSITEGFGFAFLEAWTGSKLLSGRLLPEICQDFINNGIQLDHLYRRIMVPLAWIDAPALQEGWFQTMRDAALQYNLDLPEQFITEGWRRITDGDKIDFGLLDESFQYQILCKVIQEKKTRDLLCRNNTGLLLKDEPSRFHSMIERNHEAVLQRYGLRQYINKLIDTYEGVVDHPVIQQVEKRAIAMSFFVPETFSLLKWRPFHG